jgi:hypothetical protein
MASITVVESIVVENKIVKGLLQILIAVSTFLTPYGHAAPVESSSSSALNTLLALQSSTASSLPDFFSISDKIQILVESTQKALNVEVTSEGEKLIIESEDFNSDIY